MSPSERILADRYRIDTLIGQGGMSTVYRGTDTKLGRPVAIKILKSELANDGTLRERFRQEAQSASRMAHPTIVRVYDAGDDLIQTPDGAQFRLPFIVMEYVAGQNLRQVLNAGRLSIPESLRIMESILTALEYSHRAGVVHRDIKPANVMITSTGAVKVMDFGIARAISDTSSTVAQTSAILGTAAYLSPEQARGEVVDARTDLYSAAVVMYELLSGSVPFAGDTAVAIAYQHVSETPQPPSVHNPELGSLIDHIVLHGMKKSKTDRFISAAQFRDCVQYVSTQLFGDASPCQAAPNISPELHQQVFSADSPTGMLPTRDRNRVRSQALGQLLHNESSPERSPASQSLWKWVFGAVLGIAVIAVSLVLLNQTQNSSLIASSERSVPSLVDLAESDALTSLNTIQLVAQPRPVPDSKVPVGRVIRSEPSSGSVVQQGTVVTLYISTGPELVTVPDLAGLSIVRASEILSKAGLVVGTNNRINSATVPADTVIDGDPSRGTKVPEHSRVNLFISTGLVEVVDVLGQEVMIARDLLKKEQLTVKIIPNPECAQTVGNPVTSQNVVGAQPQSTTVELGYCTGSR